MKPVIRLLPLILILTTATAVAQQRESVMFPGTPSLVRYGIEVGGAFNTVAQQMSHTPIDNPSSPWRALESGSGVGGYAALVAEYEFAPKWSLQYRGGLELKRWGFAGSGVADCPNSSGELFDTVSMSVDLDASALYLTSGLMVGYEPVDRLRLFAGPVFHRLLGDVTERVAAEITTPGACVFAETGTTSYTSETSDTAGFAATRWGIDAGVSYRFDLTARLSLVPSARFQFMLDPLSPDGSITVDRFRERTLGRLNLQTSERTMHAAQVGVALIFR